MRVWFDALFLCVAKYIHQSSAHSVEGAELRPDSAEAADAHEHISLCWPVQWPVLVKGGGGGGKTSTYAHPYAL